MNFIKENLLTIILVMLIIIIISGIGIFCWKVIQVEDETSNITIAENYNPINNINQNLPEDNDEANKNITINNNYINMSKYYLSTTHGRVAEIYNKMLDSLGKQKYIVETSNGSDCKKSTIDLNKMCFLSEYDNFYECWAYTGGLQKKYKYIYSTGETEKNSENSLSMKSDADFVAFAVDFEITDEDYKWNYEYNENVSRNGYQCYEIVANWNGDFNNYSGENVRWDGIRKLYIDMETYKLIEYESSSYINDTIGYSTYSKFYEYSDDNLQIPKDAENYIFN